MGKLTVGKLRGLTVPGRYGDGGTLHLVISPPGTKSWVQRITINGRRHDIGLGGWPVVSLAMARDRAFANRRAVAEGRDPLAERKAARTPTFEQAVEKVIAIHGEAWKDGGKTAKLWRATLREYAFPTIGEKGVDEVTTADVLAVLVSIWTRKHETARKVRRRIGTVMKWAVARGYRQDNPAGEAITAALPKRHKQVRHMPAVPYGGVAGAIAAVRASGAWPATKLAFEFLVLTATRSGEVRLATCAEVDLRKRVWTVPAARTKTSREHRVPLCDRAVEILREARQFGDGSGLVFPSIRRKALSDMTLSKLIKEQGIAAVPHGFRSSFRDWAAERTNHPREVIEAALAHVVKNQTEAAYARSDLFERRRLLMNQWGQFVTGGSAKAVRRGQTKFRGARADGPRHRQAD